MSGIQVRKVESKADYNVFFEFPWRHYAQSPYWVPPLKSARHHTLDRQKNPAWSYMEGDYFIAWRGDKPVGTIAAFINHRHNEVWNEKIGWFGAFEFIQDLEVVQALFSTAEDYLKSRGCTDLRGPATFNLHSEIGILMNKYDRPAILLMPYNYDYYPQLIEQAGYNKVKDVYSWFTDADYLRDEEGISHRLEKINRMIDKVKERSKITVRHGNKKNLRADFEIIYELYNSAWKDNWGFVPLDNRELDAMIKELKTVYDPQMSIYAYVDGNPAGFFVGIPDLNQALHAAYPKPGIPEPLTLLKVLWHWKIRPKINTVRVPLGGIKQEYRKAGVMFVLGAAFFDVFRNSKWQYFDGGWVLEDNEDMNDVLEKSRAHRGHHYRLYQKSLG